METATPTKQSSLTNQTQIQLRNLFHPRSLDDCDWALVHISSLNNIHDQRYDQRTHKKHNSPVEVLRRDWYLLRPEGPKEDERDVDNADEVDSHSPATEAPACFWNELGVRNAAIENAAHRDAVR